MGKVIRLLLIDDDDVDRQQIRRALRRSMQKVELVEVGTAKEGLTLAQSEEFDCILLDYRLPDSNGLELLHQLCESSNGLASPIVMLTVVADDQLSVKSLREGATDFLTKDTMTPALLARAIINARERQLLLQKRIEAEKEMKQHETFLRTLLDSVPDALFQVDNKGRIQGASVSAQKMFGYSEDQLKGKSVSRLFSPRQQPKVDSLLADISKAGKKRPLHPKTLEFTARRKNGKEFPAELVSGPMEWDEPLRLLLIRDATQRHEMEAKLRQAQKMEVVGQLTGGVAHDFNNLLTAILGGLRLLEQEKLKDPAKEYLQLALDSTKRAAELTNRLLTFSRQRVLEPTMIEVSDVVTGMETLFKRTLGGNIKVGLHCHNKKLPCHADQNELENALLNLAINARDAMPSGGDLTIETSRITVGERRAERDEISPGEYALISVSDSGLGMTEEVRQKALEPFYTTKGHGKGTGLGLSTVFGFVRQSGGHLNIYSEPGVGTSVKIYLPLAEGDKAKKRFSAPAPGSFPRRTGSLKGKVILVVEDDEGVRAFAVRALKGQGFKVVVAHHGAEAVKQIDKTGRIDLLICDVVMPDEISGIEVAKAFQKKFPAGRVLFCSGYPERILRQNGRLGIKGEVLPKPYEMTTLLAKVEHNLLKAMEDN